MVRGLADAMAEKGYIGTPVADIIKRAGVSRETFYQQFDSKLDCFLAAFDVAEQWLIAVLSEIVADTKDVSTAQRYERLFGAYLDPEVVRGLLEQERQREQKGAVQPPQRGMPPAQRLPGWPAFEAQLHEVRAHGLSRSEGEILPGISAMSAPVFDSTGAIVLAVTAIGPAAIFDTRWDGEIAVALKACADQVSQRLGATPSRP